MIKLLALISARPGLSRTEFIEHYESSHVPLIRRHMPGLVEYRRNYLPEADAAQLGFDSVTILCFPDRATFESAVANTARPEVYAILSADAAAYQDVPKTRMFEVTEGRSALPAPAHPPRLKTLALIRRKPGLSREAFMDYYEKQHGPLVPRLIPQIVDYRRNYLAEEQAEALGFHSITEIFFEDAARYAAGMTTIQEPARFAELCTDEENFLVRSATRMFVVDERR
ncbi:MAG: EthD domain-containing protein [Proteobacteria bacterium]|nr:EthD domain-containing protein [Pseudomonadota bacterium]HQR04788.1 EthD domain-containing protein [Rhodocyclaceae bacterium]